MHLAADEPRAAAPARRLIVSPSAAAWVAEGDDFVVEDICESWTELACKEGGFMTEFHDWEDIRADLDDGDSEALAAERARTEAWISAVEGFDELTAERNQSVAQAAASVRAEGLTISSDAEAIMERWARGELSTTQMRELVRQLHTT
ncbi:hypothetical protein GCM10010199_59700 [Dactylosporangium roseum]